MKIISIGKLLCITPKKQSEKTNKSTIRNNFDNKLIISTKYLVNIINSFEN
jgi:hypothetical protein